MRLLRAVEVLAGGLMLILGGTAWSQTACGSQPCMSSAGQRNSGLTPPGQQPPVPSISGDTSNDPMSRQMEHDQAKLRNMDRQKQLVADTQRLLALANELKTDVDKSNKDTLSLDVIKKADEIEKLAHTVKEKMKGT